MVLEVDDAIKADVSEFWGQWLVGRRQPSLKMSKAVRILLWVMFAALVYVLIYVLAYMANEWDDIGLTPSAHGASAIRYADAGR